MPRSLILALAALLALSPARAQQGPVHLVLGTATPGGSFPAFAAALVAAVREADPDLTIEARFTKGSTENLPLLRSGRLDLALVQGEYAYDALGERREPGPAPTIVAPIDASPGLFAVTAASPVRAVADLRGRAVALGTRASGFTAMGRTVLQGSGLDPERDIRPILLDDAGEGAPMVLDGRADALWGASLGWPGFRTLARAPGGARFFGPAPEMVDEILALRPSLKRLTVPAGAFEGQEAAIETVGSWSFVMGRPGLDDAVVARLVRAIDRGRDVLARLYAQGRESDPRSLAASVPAAWLHPATAAYLREVGAAPR